MSKLKPDFILTARAHRRHHERMIDAACQGKPWHLIFARKKRLYFLYQSQVKIKA